MLQVIPKSKALVVLSALVVVGMWTNAIAAVFCPHMSGSSHHCLIESSHPHSHGSVADPQTAMEHMDHPQMSEMNMQDMTVNTSDLLMENAKSQPENDSLSNAELQVAPDAEPNSESITQPNEPCSHCMMHSGSGASYPLKSAVQNSFSTQIIAVESIAGTKSSVPSCLTLLDLHDHSPPGSSAPLYVLIGAFRI